MSRRAQLIELKLRALVRGHLADGGVGPAVEFAPGAALRHGDTAWVFLDERPATRLGAALAWALRAGAAELHVIAEQGTGTLARRAAEMAFPISVWHAEERSLLPAVAEPLAGPAAPPAHHDALRERIVAGGATPVVEHGVLFGEVRGLEVCRVVDDPHTGATRLAVGVGAHDREAFQLVHGDVPDVEALAGVVAAVARHRWPGAPQHPLNRLAAERLLRWRIEQDPALVGAERVTPAPPPAPRENVKDAVPCVAAGCDRDGRPVLVVCASGVDLDLIPYAADARLAAGGGAAAPGVGGWGGRLVIAMPPRDRVRVVDELAALLRRPAELVTVE